MSQPDNLGRFRSPTRWHLSYEEEQQRNVVEKAMVAKIAAQLRDIDPERRQRVLIDAFRMVGINEARDDARELTDFFKAEEK